MLRSRLAVAAALAALASLGTSAGFTQPAPQVRVSAPKSARRGLFNDVVLPAGFRMYGIKGAGITMAQQKRAARKARNVRRHKRNVRG